MLKPLRQMLLVNMGSHRARWESDIIVAPEQWSQIDSIGVIVGVGGKCKRFSEADKNKRVLVGIINNGDHRFSPIESKELGLPELWHFLVHENKIKMMLED